MGADGDLPRPSLPAPRDSRPLVWHPFLLALYPVVFLYAANAGEARLNQVWFPSAVLELLAGVLILLGLVLYRDLRPAGILASAILVVFCFYGHISRPLGQIHLGELTPFRHRVLLPLMFLALLGLAWGLLRRRNSWSGLTSILNSAAAILLALALLQAGQYELSRPPRTTLVPGEAITQRSPLQTRPDIYVLIADEYARTDTMLKTFGVDDSAFLENLRQMGFVVARGSQCNYSRTTPSLASFLNLDYLPALQPDDLLDPPRDPHWMDMIRRNRAMAFVRRQGYRTVSYVSSWTATQGIENLDLEVDSTPHFNEFTGLLIRGSFISFLQDVLGLADLDPEVAHRVRVLDILDDLQTRPRAPDRPTFTFAHIPAPHEPFVLRADGSLIPREAKERLGFKNSFYSSPPEAQERMYQAFYPDQARFVAGRLETIARTLLERPGPKPIILIASDHGSCLSLVRLPYQERYEPSPEFLAERFPNLIALHMPGIRQEDLDGISLVNVLRLILREGLQADLPPLPDRFFFVSKHLREVTEPVLRNRQAALQAEEVP
ncbi:MAG: LTA synthase family protein [Burkholderiales bacterium]|nr:LTA synthase family protein [Burkholderiales bacterium]